MASFTSMITRVQGLVGNHSLATATVVGTFVNSRHDELLHQHEWHRRKSEVIMSGVADYTTGTIAVINDNWEIAGTDTVWISAMTGRAFRINDSLFTFNYVSGVSGNLTNPQGALISYPGATESGFSYVMFKRFYSLGTAIEEIISVNYQSRITERDQEWLDTVDPLRQATGTPVHFIKGPRDQTGSNDLMQIELYPRLTSAVSLQAFVLKGHTDLAGVTNPIVPSYLVEWAAAVDSSLHLFSKTKETKWLDLAVIYEKKKEAAFEIAKQEDSKQFSLSPVIKTSGDGGLGGTDFAVAHDVDW